MNEKNVKKNNAAYLGINYQRMNESHAMEDE